LATVLATFQKIGQYFSQSSGHPALKHDGGVAGLDPLFEEEGDEGSTSGTIKIFGLYQGFVFPFGLK
jgi:hypothetical protein